MITSKSSSSRRRITGALLVLAASLGLAGFASKDGQSLLNLYFYKQELTAYYTSGQYMKEIAEVAASATKFVDERAKNAKNGGKLAIVFDLDETILSNWPAIAANDFGWNPRSPCEVDASGKITSPACGLGPWIRLARSEVIQPVKAVYDLALTKGVTVFFLTGRPEVLRDASVQNLKSAGLGTYGGLILKGAEPSYPNLAAFKTAERKKISEQGFTIIANLGDQQSDLDGGFSERTFKIPNPFYFNR